ncbi:hypothetical protein [Bacillus pretiosus]|uniref:Uncharacterized protein n=1 Tax=Bacillus pretiosus TaxID=2983392 RepID=A0ABT3ES29_9BACI|nr:hypothetical protein [Bacillus pretiosus]MCW1239416.1 hypothetical protein [Bacillus pretiosus]
MFRFVPSIDLSKVINNFNELSKEGGESNG